MNGFCVPAHAYVKRTDAPPKSEGGSSSEVKRPEFTQSRSYKFIKVKFVRDCPHYAGPSFKVTCFVGHFLVCY